MKKNALVVLGLLVSLVSAGAVVGKSISPENSSPMIAQAVKITLEQARKIALKRVDGSIEEEFTIEDEEENITTYVFIIKDKKDKSFEVQIDAENGAVLSVEEIVEEADDDEPPADEPEDAEMTEDESAAEEAAETIAETEEAVETEATEEAVVESEATEAEEEEAEEEMVETMMEDEPADDPVASQPKFSMEQARTMALKKVAGEIESEELLNENGKMFYSFIIRDKKDRTIEVRVDATTGKVKKFKDKKTEAE